jgi:hypothetical protein
MFQISMLLILILSLLYESSKCFVWRAIFKLSTNPQFSSLQSMNYIEEILINVKFPQCTLQNVISSEALVYIWNPSVYRNADRSSLHEWSPLYAFISYTFCSWQRGNKGCFVSSLNLNFQKMVMVFVYIVWKKYWLISLTNIVWRRIFWG